MSMWSAFRSDLSEFVSTVTEDTSQALSKIDDSFPVLNTNNDNDDNDNEEEEEEDEEEEEEDHLTREEAQDEALRRMQLEETFTTLLLSVEQQDEEVQDSEDPSRAALQEFVTNFQVTQDMLKDLETYPELEAMHSKLVVLNDKNSNDPNASAASEDDLENENNKKVSERDFWMCYAYRCNVDRIQAEYHLEQVEQRDLQKEARSARVRAQRLLEQGEPASSSAAGGGGLLGVLGGAVKSVGASVGQIVAPSITAPSNAAAASGGEGSGFFGSGVRPPFVRNTAVDEDEDDEEEEELGWDDDDDDDDDDEEEEQGETDKKKQRKEEEEEASQDELVEFADEATRRLQEELKQALDERDTLHETVALQAKEIVTLTAAAAGAATAAAPTEMSKADVEALQLQLFEAESELVAIKTRISCPSLESPTKAAGAAAENDEALLIQQQEQQQHAAAKMKIAELEQECSSLRDEKGELAARVESLEASLAALHQERTQADDSSSARLQEQEEQQRELVRDLESKLQLAERRIAELLSQEPPGAVSTRDAGASSSPDTTVSSTASSGVKVDVPPPLLAAAAAKEEPSASAVAGNEDGSDWGDDW